MKRQRGVTLIEALVALVIMAFGMLALSGLQGNMRRSADFAKQRGEAMRLAQQDLETLRAFSVLDLPANAASNVQAYADIVSNVAANVGDPNSNTSFALRRTVLNNIEPPLRTIQVTVSWQDRTGAAQSISLDTIVSRTDPSLGASLAVAPNGAPARRPGERDASIPVGAKDLGDKTSVFKPLQNGTLAWVFDNLTGRIIGKCMVPMGTLTSALTAADVESCRNNTIGYLLSGYVRFSSSAPPDADHPSSTALPLDMVLRPRPQPNGTPPDPQPSYECYDDAPPTAVTTMSVVSYYCVVYPNTGTPPSWSGRLLIDGIALGGNHWKVCRYSADYNGDGSISNAEHPLDYSLVATSLMQQNFLVIKASAYCPSNHLPDPSIGRFVDTSTVEHQIHGLPALD